MQDQGIASILKDWPEGVTRKGVIVTSWNEQVPFYGFMLRGDLVLLQRQAPDTVGARKIILPLDQIAALKIVDVVPGKVYQAAGFEGSFPKR